jgi:hypothetical protein
LESKDVQDISQAGRETAVDMYVEITKLWHSRAQRAQEC